MKLRYNTEQEQIDELARELVFFHEREKQQYHRISDLERFFAKQVGRLRIILILMSGSNIILSVGAFAGWFS